MSKKSKINYYEYIRSEQWQRVRRKFYSSKMYKHFLGESKWNCYCCGRGDVSLDLHHRTYKRLGKEKISNDLVPVCRSCHKEIHDLIDHKDVNVWGATKMIKRKKQKEKEKNA